MKHNRFHTSAIRILLFLLVFAGNQHFSWGQTIIICQGTVQNYGVDVDENNGNGSTGSTYQWNVLETGYAGSMTSLTSSGNKVEIDWGNTAEGVYTLVVTESFGECTTSKQTEITVRDGLELNEMEDELICAENGNTTFNAGFGFDSYTWYDTDGNVIGDTRELTVEEPGSYTVEVTAGTCSATQTVEAIPIDFPIFTVNNDAFGTIIIEHIGGNIENLEYQLEDLEGNVVKSWQVSNIFNNVQQGFYIVRIRSWDATCSTYITASTISIPNFFSPNGDGINDEWDLSRLQTYAPNARIEIYDRYGKMIEILDINDGFKWDGRYLGKPLASTTYYYIMHMGDEKLTGTVTIKNR